MTPEPFFEAGMQTGEGPVWDARRGLLYCVDSTNPGLWMFDPVGGLTARHALPERVGFAALTEDDGRLVLGLKSGLHAYHLASRRLTLIVAPEPDRPGNRINDGVADIDGGLIFGTLDDSLTRPTGAAYKLFPDGRLVRFDDGYVVFNGPFPTPDGRLVYAVDSEARRVHVFERGDDGVPRRRREFTDWPTEWGIPDGLVADVAGDVWIAHWDGAALSRFSPGGTLRVRIGFPVSRVTKPAFGGEGLRTLFVTTANRDVDPKREPLAGSVFRLDPGCAGLPAPLVAAGLLRGG